MFSFPQWDPKTWACHETEKARSLLERGLERYHDDRFQRAKCYLENAKNVCSAVFDSLSSIPPYGYDDVDEICRDAFILLLSITFKLIECCVRLKSWSEVVECAGFYLALERSAEQRKLGRQIRALEYRALALVELNDVKSAVNDYELLSKIPDIAIYEREQYESKAESLKMNGNFSSEHNVSPKPSETGTKDKKKKGCPPKEILQYHAPSKSKKQLQREQFRRKKESETIVEEYMDRKEKKLSDQAEKKLLAKAMHSTSAELLDSCDVGGDNSIDAADSVAELIPVATKQRKKRSSRKRLEEKVAKTREQSSGADPKTGQVKNGLEEKEKSRETSQKPRHLLGNLVARLPLGNFIANLGFHNHAVVESGILVCRICYDLQKKKVSKVDPAKGTMACKEHSTYSCLPVLLHKGSGSEWVRIRPRPRKIVSDFTICSRSNCQGPCTFPHSEEEKRAWEADRQRSSGYRLPPLQRRLVLCKDFLKFEWCPHGRRCWHAHGIKELGEWKQLEASPQLPVANTSSPHVKEVCDNLRSALRKEDYSRVASCLADIEICCNPKDMWQFISSDGSRPHQCTFDFEIRSHEVPVNKIVLLQDSFSAFQLESSTQENCRTFQGGQKKVRFTVRFNLEGRDSAVASRAVDMIIDCRSRPYLVKRLYVYVGSESDRQSLDFIKKSFQPLPEHWDLDDDAAIRKCTQTANYGEEALTKKYQIPDLNELCVNLESLDLLGGESATPVVKADNYARRFHTLIHLEELEWSQSLQKFTRRNIALKCEGDDQYRGLRTVHLDCLVPPRVVQDSTAYLRLSSTVYEVPVYEVREFGVVALEISQNLELFEKLQSAGEEPFVDFQLTHARSFFCNLHRGIDGVPPPVLRSHVCPSTSRASSPATCIKRLQTMCPKSPVWENVQQRKAVDLICQDASDNRHVIINGPFGTGKTFLLKEAILLLTRLNKQATILVCTQTNHAADLYVKELDECFTGKLVRVCFQWRKLATIPRVVQKYCTRREKTKDGREYYVLPNLDDLSKTRPLVVVTTLTTSQVLNRDDTKRGFFSHIIIDEAAQATEPESVIPLALAGERTVVVLAGDHRQINPQVVSPHARRGKLQRSLFRRLFDVLRNDVVNLYSNYRCHCDILGLATRLFYGGLPDSNAAYDKAIREIAQAKDQSTHPDFHPFGFVALSPGNAVQQGGRDGSYFNAVEATVIVAYLRRIVERWPEEWGGRDLSEICVVSSESMQVYHIRNVITRCGLKGVSVLTSRSIQGCQFRAVLISTVMTSSGDVESYEKEPSVFSDKKMLNTAITRAKSLVLVFGEIDSLVKSKIGKTWEQFVHEAWKAGNKSLLGDKETSTYLKAIVHQRTLNPDAASFEPQYQENDVAVLQVDSDEDDAESSSSESEVGSSTVDSYQRYIRQVSKKWSRRRRRADDEDDDGDGGVDVDVIETEEFEGYEWRLQTRRTRRMISDDFERYVSSDDDDGSIATSLRAKYQDHFERYEMEELRESEPNTYVRCRLKIRGRGDNCIGIPIDSRAGGEILIEGYRRRNRAFDGEEVLVEKISEANDDIQAGKVVGIFRQQRPTHYVCKLYEGKTDMLAPIDSSQPIFINCPSKFQERHERHHGKCVLVFESLQEIGRIKEKKSACVHAKAAASKLFVVEFVKWKKECTFPLGIVIGVVEPGLTYEHGLRLLDIQYIGYNELKKYKRESDDSFEPPTIDGSAPIIRNAFTIDPPQSQDLDDALAIERLPNGCYKVHVLITDVDSVVKADNDLDERAQQLGTTVYDYNGGVRLPMLPSCVSTRACSLLPNEPRRVISTSFTLSEEGKRGDIEFSSKIIQSCCKLSYESADMIIAGRCTPDVSGQVIEDVRLLHRLGQKIRAHRLRSTPIANFSAHELVEEFMITTNSAVAKALLGKCKELCILNSQLPPVDSRLSEWAEKVGEFARPSARLTNAVQNAMPRRVAENRSRASMHVLMSKVRTLSDALDSDDADAVKTAVRFVYSEKYHPQIAMWLSKYLRTMQRAQYTTQSTDPQFPRKHDQLAMKYCHFTSPVRRFVDLVNQRLLKKFVLNGATKIDYSQSDVGEIGLNCSYRRQMAKKFGKESALLKFACDIFCYPVSTVAVVESVSNGHFELYVPDCVHFPSGAGRIRLSSLNASTANLDAEGIDIEWKVALLHDRRQPQHFTDGSLAESKFVPVSVNLWTKLSDPVANENVQDLQHIVSTIKREISSRRITADNRPSNVPSIKKQIAVNDLLSIQVASRSKGGLLQPYVQLLNFPDGLSICLEHNTHPAECFASTLDAATQRSSSPPSAFDSFEHYASFWLPVIQAESATASVKTSGTATPSLVNNLVVTWSRSDDGLLRGRVELDKRYADKRKIARRRGDYVCLRYFNLKLPEKQMASRKAEGSRKGVWDEDTFFGQRDRFNIVIHCHICDTNEEDYVESGEEGETKRKKCFLGIKQCAQSPATNSIDLETISSVSCVAQFIHSSVPFRRMRQSLIEVSGVIDASENVNEELLEKIVMRSTQQEAILSSQRVDDSKYLSLPEILGREKRLNSNQCKAVRRALETEVTVIQGPPGTGKTVTGVHIAWWLAQQNAGGSNAKKRHLYYCAPSNEAVDLVAKMLQRLTNKKRGQEGVHPIALLRVYGGSIESQSYRGLSLFKRYQPPGIPEVQKTESEELKGIALHHRIRNENHLDLVARNLAQEIRRFEERFRDYSHTDRTPTEDEADEYKDLVRRAEKLEILSADVILCTCVQSGGARLRRRPERRMAQVIVDEAGQCTEPETMVAVVAAQHKIVLIGDHKQLQPVVQNRNVDSVLSKSMFERLSERAIMLDEQYRMHEDLCAFPSKMFYEGRLKTSEAVKRRRLSDVWSCWRHLPARQAERHPIKPYCFVSVRGKEDINAVSEVGKGGEESKSNAIEADLVVHIVLSLTRAYDVPSSGVRILTPYTAQKSLIEKKLELKRVTDVRVCTIFESQGGEADFVVLSTVRSLPDCRVIKSPTRHWKEENVGFVADEHQMNVALTRARRGLVIIGNENVLRFCHMWRKLLELYKDHSCLLNSSDAKRMFFFR